MLSDSSNLVGAVSRDTKSAQDKRLRVVVSALRQYVNEERRGLAWIPTWERVADALAKHLDTALLCAAMGSAACRMAPSAGNRPRGVAPTASPLHTLVGAATAATTAAQPAQSPGASGTFDAFTLLLDVGLFFDLGVAILLAAACFALG